jgi:phage terminase large subunit-like protein
MVNNNDALKKMGVIANASSIIVPSTSSQFKPVIGKPGDGSSPSMSVIDEYHEHATSDAYDTMLSGMGARQQPLMWVITTAGDNLAGPCYAKQLYIQDILTGAVEDERTFGLIYTIDPEDDWTSPEALRKANPNLDVSVNSEFLLNEQAKAIRNPRDQGRFKTKHLNIWVNSRSAYLNMESWAKCPAAPPLESLQGRRCWIALDLASKVDIAALEMLFPLGDGHYARYGKSYLPEATVEDPKNAHYQQWRDQGFLEVTDGNIIDFSRIEEDVLELCEMFEVTDVSYDPFQGTYLSTRLQDRGVSVVEFKQTVERLSDPMKTLDAWIQAGLLHHNCGPAHPMTWQLSNVVAKADRKDNVFPTKEREEKKIDNPVAQMMCVGRAIEGRPSGESAYETKELFVL